MKMEEKACLLFCDTFGHNGDGDLQLDLVGFSRPVAVSEVRVIPNGCKVHPEITDRLGETKPTSFKLEMFIKNLSKPNATVFEKLGTLDYEEGKSIQLLASSKVATNVVLLRGWYQSLTICIYGNIMNLKMDPNQAIPPPPPSNIEMNKNVPLTIDPMLLQQQNLQAGAIAGLTPVFIQTQGIGGPTVAAAIPPHMEQMGYHSPNYGGNQSPHREEGGGFHERDFDYHRSGAGEFRQQDNVNDERDSRYNRYNRDQRFDDDRRMFGSGRREYFDRNNDNFNNRDRNRRSRDNSQSQHDQPTEREHPPQPQMPTEELFEPLSPDPDFGDDSQEAPNKTKKKETEQIGYEDIESDEDLMLEDFDFDDVNLQNDFDTNETWESVSLSFNPYESSLAPLENVCQVTESIFEKSVKQFKSVTVEPSQVKQLQDYIVSDSEAERDAKWVTMLEELPNIVPTAMAYLRSQVSQKIKEKHFLSIITEWAIYGLNMEKVQTLPLAVNIRFLKASLKLTCLLANACSDYLRLLVENDVQKRLIDLLRANHVASSIKLLILKALDACTNNAFGMECFLGWQSNDDGIKSLYEELIVYWLNKPTVRVVVAMKALLEKIHYYEALSNMQAISLKISESPSKEATRNQTKDTEEEGEVAMETGDKEIKKAVDLNISLKDVNDLLASLHHVYNIIDDGDKLICQPSVFTFPTSSKVQDNIVDDCYPTIMRLLQSRRFIESLTVIVSSPLFCEPSIYAAIRDLLCLLMNTSRGLLLLSLDIVATNNLIRVLLQIPCENDVDHNYMPTLQQFIASVESKEQCYPHHLGLLLVYHLQSLQYINQLLKTAKAEMTLVEMDSTDNITMLHTLYAMTFTPVGCDAVTFVLSQADNLTCILPFLTGGEEFENKLKKSVSSRYAAVLLNLVLRHSKDVEIHKKFGTKLLSIPKLDNETVYDQIHSYLQPLEKVSTLDLHAIPSLLEMIKNELDDFKHGSPGLKGVLVALRLLHHLVGDTKQKETQKDLQRNLVIIQMFSSNALEVFLHLYDKISERLHSSTKQSEPLVNNQCSLLLLMIPLLLNLTDALLTHLLSTSYCFKDHRLIQKLLQLHKILCSKPPNGYMETILTQIQADIVGLLMKFLKATKSVPDSEEAVKSSTWYILFKEVLSFTVEKPENFVSGIILLSEVLPTPFPVHSLYELKEGEIKKIMNNHLYAMANISFLGNELKLLLKTVIGSSSSSLQYFLRRVVCQLVDLGASVSGLIIRCLVELINDDIDKANKEFEESVIQNNLAGDTTIKKRVLSSVTINTFSLLSYLVCQPGGKVTLLSLLSTTEESVTEFPDFVNKLMGLGENYTDSSYLENNLLPFLQSVCDHEICMESFDGVITLLHLSNSLPSVSLLSAVVELLFSLLKSETVSVPAIIRSLNILESLTDHDFGMHVISQYLTEKGDCLNTFLSRVIKDVENKTDTQLVYAAISTFIEFLSLTNSSGPENYMKPYLFDDDIKMDDEEVKVDEEAEKNAEESSDKKDIKPIKHPTSINAKKPLQRTIFMNGNILKQIFKLDDKTASEHLLTKLEKLIEEESKCDEDLVSLSQAITTLRMIMIATSAADQVTNEAINTLVLLPPESLQAQFSARLTSILMNNMDDERASSNDWFDAEAPDEVDSDAESDNIKVDLLQLSEKYLPSFKYKEEIEKGFIDTTVVKRSKRLKHTAFYKAGDHIEDTKRLRFDASALSTHPTMRGIGRGANRGMTRGYFNRGNFNRGGSRGFNRGFGRGRGRGRGTTDMDGFRQRRQNTSRPPSMHVDDFMNMEKKGDTLMAHSKQQENDQQAATSDRHQVTNANTNFNSNSGGGNTRWNTPHFRRSNDDNQQGDGNARYGGYNNTRTNYYNNPNNKFHNRSTSDWNNTNYSQRGGRDGTYSRRGGGNHWSANKTGNNDNRSFSGSGGGSGNGGYRQGGRGNRQHMRTFTR